ncbi:hypothetical protein BJV74DRAFT_874765 [Russula compacta]|nr:hypothetical protein BJV74DRAFT_874765 [Russula compacta]
MRPRTLVVQTHTRLQKMAIPGIRISIPSRTLPCLHIWHASSRHAGTFPSSSAHHRAH